MEHKAPRHEPASKNEVAKSLSESSVESKQKVEEEKYFPRATSPISSFDELGLNSRNSAGASELPSGDAVTAPRQPPSDTANKQHLKDYSDQ